MIYENQNKSVVRLNSISKSFSENGHLSTPIRDVSLHAILNEMILLIGPSGSGKTTLLSIIAGLIPQSSGQVHLFGKSICNYNQHERKDLRLKKIGFVFQSFNLIDCMTAIENVSLPAKFTGLTKNESLKKAKQIMEHLSIYHLAEKFTDKLSQGEKQRVAIARAFINEPDLIIADEPSACLEAGQGLEIIKLLSEYAQSGKCVIVASHDTRLCDFTNRILLLQNGQLIQEENRKSIYKHVV